MATIEWTEAGQYTDIKYHKADGIAKITINRPEVRNAFRPLTVEEMIRALDDARERSDRRRGHPHRRGPRSFLLRR